MSNVIILLTPIPYFSIFLLRVAYSDDQGSKDRETFFTFLKKLGYFLTHYMPMSSLYPLRTTERFSYIFRGYKNGPRGRNGLITELRSKCD